MKIQVLNNFRYKRAFSNRLWFKKGYAFIPVDYTYIMIGLFGFIFSIMFYPKYK